MFFNFLLANPRDILLKFKVLTTRVAPTATFGYLVSEEYEYAALT